MERISVNLTDEQAEWVRENAVHPTGYSGAVRNCIQLWMELENPEKMIEDTGEA